MLNKTSTVNSQSSNVTHKRRIFRQWSSVKRQSGKDYPSNATRHWLTIDSRRTATGSGLTNDG
jgi:hypothetical protein